MELWQIGDANAMHHVTNDITPQPAASISTIYVRRIEN